MKHFLTLISLFCICFTSNAQKSTLQFGKDGKFKIVQFTDVHMIYGSPKSDIAIERINDVLDAEKPDLVMFTGDVIFGAPAEKGMRKVFELVAKRNIPFAVTFGNHDNEYNLNKEALLKIFQSIPGNLNTTAEGVSGYSNFALPILSSDGKNKTQTVIYGFDSHSYSQIEGIQGYDYIKIDQIMWYRGQSAAFTAQNDGKPVFSLAFLHIPLYEYKEALEDITTAVIGTKLENICCANFNNGLFVNFRELGDVKAVFCGHDHNNDFALEWKGILLAYGRYTGGDTVYNRLPNGARIIELTEGSSSFDTWIRLADGVTQNPVTFPNSF